VADQLHCLPEKAYPRKELSVMGREARNLSALRTLLVLAAVTLASSGALAQGGQMIRLSGTPEEIGTLWGEMNKDIIVRDVDATYLKKAAEAGISREILIERSALFVEIAERLAPHWLVEGRAIARAAGVDEELYIAFFDGQSRNRFLYEETADATPREAVNGGAIVECTSYAVFREYAQDEAIFFHKTRDNIDRPQLAFIVDSSLEKINKFIAVTDGSRIKCSMMVNDKGLAGSGDYPAALKKDSSTLHLEPAAPKFRGWMGGTILRHVAERASNCADALAIIEDLVAKGHYSGGKVNGSHWLFVDREGVILEICNNARNVVSKVHTQKAYFSRFNKSAAAKRLRGTTDPIDFGLFRRISRDKSVCFKSSISGMTVEIDPDYPELFTCAWIALPARATAFPVFMGQDRIPASLVDGNAYLLGKKSPRDKLRWEAMEESMHAEKEALKNELKGTIKAGKSRRTQVERMEDWSRKQAAMLKGGVGPGFAATTDPSFQVDYPAPTADKPQSKLWFMDGCWWALLPRASGPSLWQRTDKGWKEHAEIASALKGLPGRADVWPGKSGVTAVAVADVKKVNQSATVFRLTRSSDSGKITWKPQVLAELTPPTPEDSIETATLVQDSEGILWVAAVAGTKVCVWASQAGGTAWSGPLVLAEGVYEDDICVITPQPGDQIGVIWSDQVRDGVLMRTHADGKRLKKWRKEEVVKMGGKTADDHLNTSLSADGTLWVASKNEVDATGKPQFTLRVRTRAGEWSNWPYGLRGSTTRPSRPIVVASEDGSCVLTGYGDNDRSIPSPHDSRIVFSLVNPANPGEISPPRPVIVPAKAHKSVVHNVTGPRNPFPQDAPWIVLASDAQGRVYEADLRKVFAVN
jgi:hypothetical protein